jgi:hypothetical protein
MHTLDQLQTGIALQGPSIEDPRPGSNWVFRFDLTLLNGDSKGSRGYAQKRGCLAEIHPTLGLPAFCAVARNAVMTAQRSHTFPRPTVSSASSQATSRKHTGDHVI